MLQFSIDCSQVRLVHIFQHRAQTHTLTHYYRHSVRYPVITSVTIDCGSEKKTEQTHKTDRNDRLTKQIANNDDDDVATTYEVNSFSFFN